MSLEHAILGFLEYQPMTGYDLKKYFSHSIIHFWSATQSHIYKALNKLEEKKMVESQLIPQQGRPNRREYHLTDIGRAELHRWLTTPQPLEQVRIGWLVQIFFSHIISNEEIIALLEARRAEIMNHLHNLRTETKANIEDYSTEIGTERIHQLWEITLDHGIHHFEAELVWLEKTINQVRNLPPASDDQLRFNNSRYAI